MGTSGVALFDDDVAIDVRETYLGLLADGVDDDAATRALVDDYATDDPDEGPTFWLALAAVQWEHGRLDDAVKQRALEVIARGVDLERWGNLRARRAAVLEALAAQLASPPPRRKTPRRRKTAEVPSTQVPSPDGRWRARAFEIANLGQVLVENERGGGGVFAADCSYTELEVSWRDSRTLEIAHPPVRVETAKSSHFFAGETIDIVYRVRER